MRNKVTAEKSVKGGDVCCECEKEVTRGDLTVTEMHFYDRSPRKTHLYCYIRRTQRPIDLDAKVQLVGVTEETEVKKVKQWVDRWNSRFVPKIPEKYLMKGVVTVYTPARRRLLEVFLYLSTHDIETVAGQVSKEWFHVSRDEELWKRKYLLVHSRDTTEGDTSYRQQFIAAMLASCWVCKQPVPLQQVKMVCPVRKRVLCQKCGDKEEARIASLKSYCKERCIPPSLAQRLNVAVFKHRGENSVYTQEFLSKLVPYAEQRRTKLVEVLETEHTSELSVRMMDMIRTISVGKLFRYSFIQQGEMAFHTFLGKDDKNEDMSKSVQSFIKRLMRP